MDTSVSIASHSAPMDSMLRDARLINSDIGRHSVKCNFSTRLTGRFFQNGSLERHTQRKSRLVEMQAKKRRLEKELKLEERRVKLLEDRLNETERAREEAQEIIIKLERGVLKFQTLIRQKQAMEQYHEMKHRSHLMNMVSLFCQSRYRGWKGRLLVQSFRQYIQQQKIDESARTIQARTRCRIQRKHYLDLKLQREILSEKSASSIQATRRGQVARRMYLEESNRRMNAALNVQRNFRGMAGRMKVERLRQEIARRNKESEKPKRIPLHLRRYSTYGTSPSAPRRGAKGTKKRDITARRRSSDCGIFMMNDGNTFGRSTRSSNGDEPDENDSIATSMTSLTHATEHSRKRAVRGKFVDGRKTLVHDKKSAWPSTQRVLTSASKLKTDGRPTKSIDIETYGHQPGLRSSQGKSDDKSKCSQSRSQTGSKNTKDKPASDSIGVKSRCNEPKSDFDGEKKESETKKCNQPKALATYNKIDEKKQECNKNDDESKCNEDISESINTNDRSRAHSQPETPPREEIKTPITISAEASFIVGEVFGEGITHICIVNSVFEDEFSEHEDDLECE